MTRIAWVIALGASLTAGAGCYYPGPYPPNHGRYTYPAVPPGGYPVAPGGYPAPPGGSYIVPGQTMPGQAVPGTLGTPVPANGPTMAPPLNGGGNAPPSTYEDGANAVPNYTDPNASDFNTNPGGFQPPSEETPFMDGAAIPSPNGYAAAPTNKPDYFADLSEYSEQKLVDADSEIATPSTGRVHQAGFKDAEFGFEPTARPKPLGTPNDHAAGKRSNWYGYDHQGYRWLKGVVHYDVRNQHWCIIYGLSPEPGEKFGGALTLATNPNLNILKNRDVIQVWGAIDPGAGQDVLGKPLYRVERLELLGKFQ